MFSQQSVSQSAGLSFASTLIRRNHLIGIHLDSLSLPFFYWHIENWILLCVCVCERQWWPWTVWFGVLANIGLHVASSHHHHRGRRSWLDHFSGVCQCTNSLLTLWWWSWQMTHLPHLFNEKVSVWMCSIAAVSASPLFHCVEIEWMTNHIWAHQPSCRRRRRCHHLPNY